MSWDAAGSRHWQRGMCSIARTDPFHEDRPLSCLRFWDDFSSAGIDVDDVPSDEKLAITFRMKPETAQTQVIFSLADSITLLAKKGHLILKGKSKELDCGPLPVGQLTNVVLL
jgi:hypothetical protein